MFMWLSLRNCNNTNTSEIENKSSNIFVWLARSTLDTEVTY